MKLANMPLVRRCSRLLVVLLLAGCAADRTTPKPDAGGHARFAATYSIVGFDPATGDVGVAVQSKYFGVGIIVPWGKARVGAVASQAWADAKNGMKAVKMLEQGLAGEEIIRRLLDGDDKRLLRQFGIVDAQGRATAYTGSDCPPFAGHLTGNGYSVQGNTLVSEKVIKDMAAAFEAAQKVPGSELADWLMRSLQAGEDAGGDSRGRQAAALQVFRENAGVSGANDRFVDLRVDDHPDPTRELARLLEIHKKFYAEGHRNRPVLKAPSPPPDR